MNDDNPAPVIMVCISEPEVPDFVMLHLGDPHTGRPERPLGLYVNMEELPEDLKEVLLEKWRIHMPTTDGEN